MSGKKNTPIWREFELLVAAIEERLAPKGASVKSPDKIRDLDSGKEREVDASIRFKIGTVDILLTVECRKRGSVSDVTWIEQLATKRLKIGASKTIAVSARGFSEAARLCADRYGIELRMLDDIGPEQIDTWIDETGFVSMHREFSNITCAVECSNGKLLELDGFDERFLHPKIEGYFPALLFITVLEDSNDEVFWRVSLDGTITDVELILGGAHHRFRGEPILDSIAHGALKVKTQQGDEEVLTLTIHAKIKYVTQLIDHRAGMHYLYGAPGDPQVALSRFPAKFAGIQTEVDHLFDVKAKSRSAVMKFPSGLRMEAAMISPKLMEMSEVDSAVLHMKPVKIKIIHGEAVEGIFLHPQRHWFSSDEDHHEFDLKNFIFIDRESLAALRDDASTAEIDSFKSATFSFPRDIVEYIELQFAISAAARQPQS
jgi:hypothetical protein